MMYDYHLHTDFSPDGKQTLEELCRTAISKEIRYIAVTDHVDISHVREDISFSITDPAEYRRSVLEAAERLRSQINIILGTEIGYERESMQEIRTYLDVIKPDFVIGSLHFIEGIDPYYGIYFEGLTKYQAYEKYLKTWLTDIADIAEFSHVLGHLDYVSKFAPQGYGPVVYQEFRELIDEVLRSTVEHGLGLEINTSGWKRYESPLPGFDVIKRFRELGGERLTVGSDAHETAFVGYRIADALEMARNAGFRYIYIGSPGEDYRRL